MNHKTKMSKPVRMKTRALEFVAKGSQKNHNNKLQPRSVTVAAIGQLYFCSMNVVHS